MAEARFEYSVVATHGRNPNAMSHHDRTAASYGPFTSREEAERCVTALAGRSDTFGVEIDKERVRAPRTRSKKD